MSIDPKPVIIIVYDAPSLQADEDLFFPYGSAEGDTVLLTGDELNTDVPITPGQGFKFYGSQQSNIIVNNNGVIFFGSSSTPYLNRFPEDPPPLHDHANALITPYWADTDPTKEGANVFYRSITRVSSVDQDAFDLADDVVRMSFMELQNFQTSWMFVVTWDNLGYYSPITPSNLAGFGAGDKINSYTLEGSQTQDIIAINEKSNIGVPGRFIFKIDEANMITEPSIPTSDLFFPYGSAEGDTVLLTEDELNTDVPITPGQGFKFYGSQQSNIIVNNNGVIFFGSSSTPYLNRFPEDPPPLHDHANALITPYWADTDPTKEGANVFYRSITRVSSVDHDAFDLADDVVRMSFMELQNFQTSWMFVVTWDNLGYYSPITPSNLL
ncbi:uncharacterized protein LOC115929612 [Strongylocentrotus purpuratus]|uniref:NIDO domain-containing protein n=1 Tax=Strongylocentrotus purpuratus TaxID=7668 RepID=A0A7M7PR20_STRPU|nr:uncharacterized protein LOC115929612 [Strongylocentrotus purpuratus]